MAGREGELHWLLALETSSRVGSVVLQRCGHEPHARWLSGDRRHTSELLPAVQSLLADHKLVLRDVDVLAYSAGPGSFTGLRIGATVARMAQAAAGCRVVAVSTLEAIARNALDDAEDGRHIAVMVDARRERVYGAVYRVAHKGAHRAADAGTTFATAQARADLIEIAPPEEMTPVALLSVVTQAASRSGNGAAPILLGSGVARHAELCRAGGAQIAPEAQWPPAARCVAEIGWRLALAGEFAAPSEIVPNYLRRPECEEVYDERRAAARAKRGE